MVIIFFSEHTAHFLVVASPCFPRANVEFVDNFSDVFYDEPYRFSFLDLDRFWAEIHFVHGYRYCSINVVERSSLTKRSTCVMADISDGERR